MSGPNAERDYQLKVGDHSPIFSCPDSEGGLFDFYSHVVGKPVVMIFTGDSDIKTLAQGPLAPEKLEDERAQIVTLVPGKPEQVLKEKSAADWPFQTAADPDGEITKGFAGLSGFQPPCIYVLCPNQRVAGIVGLDKAGHDLGEWVSEKIDNVIHHKANEVISQVAPALLVPRVLEPEDCEWLIGLWREGEKQQGQVALGATQKKQDDVDLNVKRREDYVVKDQKIFDRLIQRIMPRLVPELEKIYHFTGWQMEALRIGCYKAEDEGFFRVHRDDCNPSVKDRKYALTINLNTGQYEGGDLRFPEYGQELFRPPVGGAVVFSCSMLHEVLPVTKGERFVLLSFFTQPKPE